MTTTRSAGFWMASFMAVAAFAGCGAAGVQHAQLHRPPHALSPKSPEQVEIFPHKNPSAPYIEVFRLELADDHNHARGEVLRQMRAKAGELGCDGLVLDGEDFDEPSEAPHLVTSASRRRAICIVYTGEKPH